MASIERGARHRAEAATPSASPPGMSSRRFWASLAVIVVVGIVVRLVYLAAAHDAPVFSDGLHYSNAARNLVDGRGFINPIALLFNGSEVQDAVHPPAWTLVLAASAAVGRRTDPQFQQLAVVVGAATIVMVALAATAAFNRRVGLIAAALTAVYANIWLYERELVSEPLALLGCATLIWLVYRFRASPGILLAVALGAATAVCALTRSELMLLGVIVVAPTILLVRRAPIGRRLVWLGAAGAMCLALVAPWFAYNTTRFEKPVPLSTGLGGTLAAGNCDATYDPAGDAFAYYSFACAFRGGPTSPDPSVAETEYRSRALTYISEHKSGFAKVSAARVARTFSLYAPFQQVVFESERGTPTWAITLGLWSYWVLLPLAIAGAVVAWRRKDTIYPFLALPLIVLVAVLPTIGAVRYRAPAEITLVVFAGVAIDAAVRRFRPDRGVVDVPDDVAAPPPGPDPVAGPTPDPVPAPSQV